MEGAPQHSALSRVAAVGPYIQSIPTSSAQGSPVLDHMDTLVKSTYPDSSRPTSAMQDSSLKPPPRPVKPAAGEHRNVFVSFCTEQETHREAPSSIFDSFALNRVHYIQDRHTVGVGGLVCGVC